MESSEIVMGWTNSTICADSQSTNSAKTSERDLWLKCGCDSAGLTKKRERRCAIVVYCVESQFVWVRWMMCKMHVMAMHWMCVGCERST